VFVLDMMGPVSFVYQEQEKVSTQEQIFSTVHC